MGVETRAVSEMTQQVRLRTMEPADVQSLFCMENDPGVWRYTHQGDAPYTWDEIERFVRTAPRHLAEHGQLRLVVELQKRVVGAIDLYGYDAEQAQAWVGILVWPEAMRGIGIGRAALRLLVEQVSDWSVERLCARVQPNNGASRKLFLDAGFVLQKESNSELLFQYTVGR